MDLLLRLEMWREFKNSPYAKASNVSVVSVSGMNETKFPKQLQNYETIRNRK
jgi:hypothetical protein